MSEFLKRWRSGRRRHSFEALIEPHIEHLYRVAYRLTRNESGAEDLVQDVLIKLFRIQGQVASLQQPRPWIARVLYREYVDRWRRERHAPVNLSEVETADGAGTLADNEPDPQANPEQAAIEQQLGEQLTAALERLSDDHRTVLLFHDVEGYTMDELCTVLSLPLGTVKSRIHRARARLRETLRDMDETFSVTGTWYSAR
ncbi:RNA polymerase sigma factor [Panacagrimonas sp.]|uniref:RNA polymerase sigma factor n=1 Tax=Panacagrimonas sp. TaxID=2480088 RepID=UPI003B51ECD0